LHVHDAAQLLDDMCAREFRRHACLVNFL
jgi:hypothetical protein